MRRSVERFFCIVALGSGRGITKSGVDVSYVSTRTTGRRWLSHLPSTMGPVASVTRVCILRSVPH